MSFITDAINDVESVAKAVENSAEVAIDYFEKKDGIPDTIKLLMPYLQNWAEDPSKPAFTTDLYMCLEGALIEGGLYTNPKITNAGREISTGCFNFIGEGVKLINNPIVTSAFNVLDSIATAEGFIGNYTT